VTQRVPESDFTPFFTLILQSYRLRHLATADRLDEERDVEDGGRQPAEEDGARDDDVGVDRAGRLPRGSVGRRKERILA